VGELRNADFADLAVFADLTDLADFGIEFMRVGD